MKRVKYSAVKDKKMSLAFADLRKTRLCRYWPRCNKGAWCNFAHGDQELIPKKCRYGTECWKRNCIYIHPQSQQVNQIWERKPEPVEKEEEIQEEIKEIMKKRGIEHVTVHINIYSLRE